MPIYDVDVEITYRATVQVEALSRTEARGMAERGPNAWINASPDLDHAHTESMGAYRQDSDDFADEIQAWKDKREQQMTGR